MYKKTQSGITKIISLDSGIAIIYAAGVEGTRAHELHGPTETVIAEDY